MDMTRRDAVRVNLFAGATLTGADGSLRCAVTNLSAAGAMLTVTGRLPRPPLRLAMEVGGETLELAVEVQRVPPGGEVAVVFHGPGSERLHGLIAAEQRQALARGQLNVSERRARSSRGLRGEVIGPSPVPPS